MKVGNCLRAAAKKKDKCESRFMLAAVKMLAPFFRAIKWKRWGWVALAGFAMTVLSEGYYTYLILPEYYVGNAVIELKRGAPNDDGTYEATNPVHEIGIIRSPEFLQPIIEVLKLDRTWADRDYKSRMEALPIEVALTHMEKCLELDEVPRTHAILNRFLSVEPKEAADIANAIADRYKTLRDIAEDRATTQHAERERQLSLEQIAAQEKMLDEKKKAKGDINQIHTQQAIVDGLKAHLKPTDFQQIESCVKIVSRAEIPLKPTFPDHVYNMAMSIPRGLIIGVALAMAVELTIQFIWWTSTTPWNNQRRRDVGEEY